MKFSGFQNKFSDSAIPLAMSYPGALPEASPEIRAGVQVVYLGNDLRDQE